MSAEEQGFTVYTCPRCRTEMPNVAVYKDAHHEHCSVVAARRTHIIDQAEAALDDPDQELWWWWLSFTDHARWPGGSQFLGVAIVDAPNVPGACIGRAWRLGCNPGGDASWIGPYPQEWIDEHVPPEYRRRLLTSRADLEAVGVDFSATRARPVEEQS